MTTSLALDTLVEMVQQQQDWPPKPDVSHLITSDDAPVDSFLQAAQMKLLTEPLGVWKAPGGRPFIAATNVGVFAVPKNPAIVPDMFLSLDVEPPPLVGEDKQESYFVWEHGKPPDLVIEIVSKTKGDELKTKLRQYERMRVTHYVVFDPLLVESQQELSVFTLQQGAYVQRDPRFPDLALALTRWEGDYAGRRFNWLRWTHLDGPLLPIVAEEKARADDEKTRADDANARANDEKARADDEKARADDEKARADDATSRAEALAARLRALGVDPNE